MSSWDYFKAKLLCPKCGRNGIVRLSEADGYAYSRDKSRTVVDLPEGFRVIDPESDMPEFACIDCGIRVKEK
jgi:predicted RNA-binding Zn-ribbon protein involved in translation (DUF1610 family)